MRPALVYPFTKLLNYQIFPSAAGRFGYSRFSNCCKSRFGERAAFPPKNGLHGGLLPLNVDVVFLLDIAARADAEEGIRQGLENAKEGKLRPARQFFDEFEAAHGIFR